MRSTTRTRTFALAGILSGALVLSACGGTTSTTESQEGSSSSASQADFNDADVSFVAGMKPHHEQAVEMSDIVLAADPSPEVAALAEKIKAEQEPEIEQLDEMLAVFGAAGGGHSGMDMGGDMDMSMGHGGMMSAGQMRQLMSSTGPEAERAAAQDASQRAERAVASAARRTARAELHAVDAPLDAFAAALDSLTRAGLLLAGYHRHHGGEWRRRRDG